MKKIVLLTLVLVGCGDGFVAPADVCGPEVTPRHVGSTTCLLRTGTINCPSATVFLDGVRVPTTDIVRSCYGPEPEPWLLLTGESCSAVERGASVTLASCY